MCDLSYDTYHLPCLFFKKLFYLRLRLCDLFLYQARESSLVPAGFLFLQNMLFMKPCCHGRTKVRFLCIPCMKKAKWREVYSSSFQAFSTFPFLRESNKEKHHTIPPIKTKASSITVSAETELPETLLGPASRGISKCITYFTSLHPGLLNS